jgi:hypothetical protein
MLTRAKDDAAVKERCTDEAFDEIAKHPEWDQVLDTSLSLDLYFMTVYHAAYRRDLEYCLCRSKLQVRETLRSDRRPE